MGGGKKGEPGGRAEHLVEAVAQKDARTGSRAVLLPPEDYRVLLRRAFRASACRVAEGCQSCARARDTQVRDVMTSDPESCGSEASVADVAKLMAEQDVGSIPVVSGERLVGLLTDRDIVVRVVAAGRDPQATSVGDVAARRSASSRSAAPSPRARQ